MIPDIVPKKMNIVHSNILILSENLCIEKPFEFVYGFKSHCTSINELFYELEGYLHSRPKNKINTFPPFSNEFLP